MAFFSSHCSAELMEKILNNEKYMFYSVRKTSNTQKQIKFISSNHRCRSTQYQIPSAQNIVPSFRHHHLIYTVWYFLLNLIVAHKCIDEEDKAEKDGEGQQREIVPDTR